MVLDRRLKSMTKVFVPAGLKTNWNDPSWWDKAAKRLYFKYVVGNKGIYVLNEQWDNLILLDALRYDMFKQVNNLPGVLEYRISRGSCTNEFLKENFKGRRSEDVVYITANPLVDYHAGNCFHKIVSVWKSGWDEEYDTVLPETMVKYSVKAVNEYPDKRLIIHFVQPHYPFLGENARKEIGEHAGMGMARQEALGDDHAQHKHETVWDLFRKNKIDKGRLWSAYRENLELTLPHVKDLLEELPGKTVVSTDHANLFGERIPPLFTKEYGHPCGIYAKNLVRIPWFIVKDKPDKRSEKGRSEREYIRRRLSKFKNRNG